MVDFLPSTLNALLQALLFLAFPLVWWLFTARRAQPPEPFWSWLGWRRPRFARPGQVVAVMLISLLLFGGVGVLLLAAAGDEGALSPLTGRGWSGLGAAVVYALVQTAFTEETVFRGFILKRVAERSTFRTGNVVQAVLFGLAHMVPLLLLGLAPWISAGVGVFSAAVGLVMGWLNERRAGGSIVPGWILHATANLGAALVTLFLLG